MKIFSLMSARQVEDSANKGKNYRAEIETTKYTKEFARDGRERHSVRAAWLPAVVRRAEDCPPYRLCVRVFRG
jgi:hypothetical protein